MFTYDLNLYVFALSNCLKVAQSPHKNKKKQKTHTNQYEINIFLLKYNISIITSIYA